jgi:hypothetical protein
MILAGVDSPCERTVKALIQALRHDVRLLTLLKPELDAEVELELLDDRINSSREEHEPRGAAMLRVFFGRGKEEVGGGF